MLRNYSGGLWKNTIAEVNKIKGSVPFELRNGLAIYNFRLIPTRKCGARSHNEIECLLLAGTRLNNLY